MSVVYVVAAVSVTVLAALVTPARTQPTSSESTALAGTAWTVVELAGEAVPVDATPAARQPHLVFGADGRLSGSDGCNRLTGSYTVKANGISFGQIAGTRMACPNADTRASRFHAAMKGTSHWSIVNGRLHFLGATGKPLAVLARRDAGDASAQGGNPAASFTAPVTSRGPAVWKCASGNAGSSTVRVTYYETQPAFVLLERDGVARPAFQVRAASGARFEGDDVLFWESRGQATLNWLGMESTCTPQ
jgi:heat shock protein HslJ